MEEQWQAIKGSIMTSADASVGRARKKHPVWFTATTDELTTLLDDMDLR